MLRCETITVAAAYERQRPLEDGTPLPPMRRSGGLRRERQKYTTPRWYNYWRPQWCLSCGFAVEMTDGSFGVVIELPDDGRPTNLPIVKQLKLADGRSAGPKTIDLFHSKGMEILRSVRSEEMNFNVTSVFLA